MISYQTVKEQFFEKIKSHPTLSKHQKGIFEAFEFGELKHQHEKRKNSNEPYFIHCTSVAISILSEPDVEKDFVISALLHDTVEDTDVTIEELEKKYGNKVSKIVKGLTKLPNSYKKEMGEERYYKEAFFGPIVETAKILPFIWKIKLADRFNNLQGLWEYASAAKKKEYVWETHQLLDLSKGVSTPLRDKITEELMLHYQE